MPQPFDIETEQCQHTEIVPFQFHLDGSIDGMCAKCLQDGFPIRDVSYERFVRHLAWETRLYKLRQSLARFLCWLLGHTWLDSPTRHLPGKPYLCRRCSRRAHSVDAFPR